MDCLVEEETELRETQGKCPGLQVVVAASPREQSLSASLHTWSSSLKAHVVHLDEKCADFTQLQKKRNSIWLLHYLYTWFHIVLIILLYFQVIKTLSLQLLD